MTVNLNEEYIGADEVPQGSNIEYEYTWTCTPIAYTNGQIDGNLPVITINSLSPETSINIPVLYEYKIEFELNASTQGSTLSTHSTFFDFYIKNPYLNQYDVRITETSSDCYRIESGGGL